MIYAGRPAPKKAEQQVLENADTVGNFRSAL